MKTLKNLRSLKNKFKIYTNIKKYLQSASKCEFVVNLVVEFYY